MNPPRSEKVVNTNGNNFKKIKEFFESFSVQIPTSNLNFWKWYISIEFLKLKRKFKNKTDKYIIGIYLEKTFQNILFSKKDSQWSGFEPALAAPKLARVSAPPPGRWEQSRIMISYIIKVLVRYFETSITKALMRMFYTTSKLNRFHQN